MGKKALRFKTIKNLAEIKEIVQKSLPKDGQLVYLTYGGSTLFGLDTPKSDIDLKGLFLPSDLDTRQYKPYHLDLSSNKTNEKNTENDVDIEMFSIETFFKMLLVGDTNAMDLLFSLFREDTILLKSNFSDVIKSHYKELLCSNSKAFLGYVLSQTKKYGVKGERFNALKRVQGELLKYIRTARTHKVGEFIEYLEVNKVNIPYVEIHENKNKSRSNGGGLYLEVLSRQFIDTATVTYLKERLDSIEKDYGERSKRASKGIDYKSLSHALRIILEYEELLETHFIEFPLKEEKRKMILKVKLEDLSDFNNDYKQILKFLEEKIELIDQMILDSGLVDNINPMVLNKLNVKLLATRRS
jgi:predicted nucleotidyltransferase